MTRANDRRHYGTNATNAINAPGMPEGGSHRVSSGWARCPGSPDTGPDLIRRNLEIGTRSGIESACMVNAGTGSIEDAVTPDGAPSGGRRPAINRDLADLPLGVKLSM